MDAVVGREQELAQLASFLGSIEAGPGVLVIEGEPGIGKTTVWREGVRLAEEGGFRVLSCRPAESEARLSFSGLADLVEPVTGRLGDLPDPQRRALEVALLRVAPGERHPDARAVAAGLRSLLALSAVERRVLLAVDDAQWLDSPSAAAIEYAFRRIEGPVGLLAARRPGAALDAVLGAMPTMRLAPLSLGAIHHIVRAELGTAAPRPTLTRIYETAAGNPFYALQIARVALAEAFPSGGPLPLPSDLSGLVLRRIESLAPHTREILLTVAAAGSPTRELLVDIHGDPEGALEEAEDAGIVVAGDREIRFSHPLYAAAVYGSVGHEHRRRVHGRLASATGEPEEQARHLALAAVPPDEETARRVHSAAREVVARGAPGAAAELFEQAIRLEDPRSPDAVARLADLGWCLHTTGNSQRAVDVLQPVDSWSEQTVETQIRGIFTLTEALYWTAAGEVPVTVAERLLETVDAPLVRAALHAKIAAHLEYDMARGLEHADAALALLEQLGDAADPTVLALALGMRARNRLALGLGLDREGVEQAILLDPGGEIAQSYGQWLKYVDDFDGSRLWLERNLRECEETGDDASIPNVLQQLAMTECWAGNLDLAALHAERACALAAEMEITSVGPDRIRAVVEAYRGNESEVRAIAARLHDEGWEPYILQHLEIALGLLELSLGRLEAADRHLESALDLAERSSQLEPGVHRVHGDAAEVAIALGDPSRARRIAEQLDEHGRRTEHRWSSAVGARTRALLQAGEGDLDGALDAVGEAMAIQARLPMPYELGRTFLVRGQIERRARQRRAARDSLEQARTIFDEMGAKLWAARAADELRRIPIRRGASDELTDLERRVAELAASGQTNKEVAQALFISPKTVEANLSRVYGKLGIRSRAELGARMAERAKT
jgi:DNA-binding CsgD family transcriptional regulator